MKEKIVVFDGATGSNLQARGLTVDALLLEQNIIEVGENTMNAQQNVSSQQIISAVQTMPLDELDHLVRDVLAVRAERIAPHLSGEEAKLLRTIQRTLPKKTLLRMKKLQALRDDEKLSLAGFAELAGLIEKLEVIHAERIKAVVILADLRGVTFQIAMQQLGLRLPDYE